MKPISSKELNPFDAYALDAAVKIKAADASVQISVLCMGDSDVVATLRNAVAIAADDGFQVPLPADITAPLQKSRILANAIRSLPDSHIPDCIFTGAEAPALNSGNIPAMLSEYLGYPFVSAATTAAVVTNASACALQIETERDGYLASLAVPLPCVVSFTKTPDNPGHPSVPGILKSQNMHFSVIHVALPEPLNPIQTLRTVPLRKDRDTQMITADDATQKAVLLIRRLTESGIL